MYRGINWSLYDLWFLRMVTLTMEYSNDHLQKKSRHLLMSHMSYFLTLAFLYKAVHMNNSIQLVHTMVASASSVSKYIVHLKKTRSSCKKNVT
jgi:hypothetical protein